MSNFNLKCNLENVPLIAKLNICAITPWNNLKQKVSTTGLGTRRICELMFYKHLRIGLEMQVQPTATSQY